MINSSVNESLLVPANGNGLECRETGPNLDLRAVMETPRQKAVSLIKDA